MLTIVTLYVLLNQMDGISYIAGVAAETTLSGADLLGLRRSMRIHAAGGLVVLLLLVTLSIYKPRGMTRYGWRKQHEQSEASHRISAGPRHHLDYTGRESRLSNGRLSMAVESLRGVLLEDVQRQHWVCSG